MRVENREREPGIPQGSPPLLSDTAKVLLLITGMSAVRAAAAVSFPLLASEAYYWLWGQHLALGYFDHPPMVGWLSALFLGWIKGSQLAARSGPIILAAFTTWTLYRLAKELFPDGKTAWHAAALLSFVPIFDLGSVVIQPDNGLALFVALTWLLFWRAAHEPERMRLWVLTGTTAGLALLSKFHAWALLPPLGLFLVLQREHRPALRKPGPWVAATVALIVLSPNLFWNARHHWMTYMYQSRRSGLETPAFKLNHLVTGLAGPLASLSPLVYLAVITALCKGWRIWRRDRTPGFLYLILAGAPLPLLLCALSPLTSIALHWPALGYIPLLILAVHLMEQRGMFAKTYRRLLWLTAIGMSATLHVAPFLVGILPGHLGLPHAGDKPTLAAVQRELIDWTKLGAELRSLWENSPSRDTTWLLTPDDHMASQLAFYSALPDRFSVLFDQRRHNFALWGSDRQARARGSNAMIVIPHAKATDLFPVPQRKYQACIQTVTDRYARWEFGPSLVCGPHTGVVLEPHEGPRADGPRRFQILFAYGRRNTPGGAPESATEDPEKGIAEWNPARSTK